ncbi:MAG: amidohydrolase family protein [Actinomycetota bacterium]
MITTIVGGSVLDTSTMSWLDDATVVLDGDRIADVGDNARDADRVIDATGGYVVPGFIDAHVHHVLTTMDFAALGRQTPTELAISMAQLSEAMLRRGFTTVRDCAGDTAGLVRAIERGLVAGPRIVRAGRAISQTGGHGDIGADPSIRVCACAIHRDDLAFIADSPDAARLAARRELRDGAAFIKLMASGGVASPTDPFDSVQFTPDEVRAITIETDHRHTYTTAHAYHPEAIMHSIDNGVRCIEHGNLVDEPTAAAMAEHGVTMVPTLVTYKAIAELGEKLGFPEVSRQKNAGVFDAGRSSIDIAKQAGVALGFGTDLIGEAQVWQNQEFAIRAQLEPAADVLASMYRVNPRLCHLEGEIGVLSPGAAADVVVLDVDPLDALAALAEPDATIRHVIARGELVG